MRGTEVWKRKGLEGQVPQLEALLGLLLLLDMSDVSRRPPPALVDGLKDAVLAVGLDAAAVLESQ